MTSSLRNLRAAIEAFPPTWLTASVPSPSFSRGSSQAILGKPPKGLRGLPLLHPSRRVHGNPLAAWGGDSLRPGRRIGSPLTL
jgi:hypothetical protein